MKKIIIIILFTSSINALSASWPSSMYSINNIFFVQFSSLKSYMNKIMSKYPYYIHDNQVDFYNSGSTSNQKIFSILVTRDIKKYEITEILNFYVRGMLRERLIINRVGTNIPTTLHNLINFKFYLDLSIEQTNISFVNMKISQRVLKTVDGSISTYRPFGDDYAQVNLIEIENNYELFSKLYYQCDVCDGKPLIARMSLLENSYGDMSYFKDNETESTTPQNFFKKSSGYLGGLYGSFSSIPSKLVKEFGFPKDN